MPVDRPADEPVDIGIERGRIVAIDHALAADAEIFDAGGRLTCAGLVETHIHLDKSRIIERCAPPAGREVSPVRSVAPLKRSFTVQDVRMRAERTLRDCIADGTTRMRTQVEVDPAIAMRGFDAVASLIADYRWAIDIAVVIEAHSPEQAIAEISRPVAAFKRGKRTVVWLPAATARTALSSGSSCPNRFA
jgi:cytosine deaminase